MSLKISILLLQGSLCPGIKVNGFLERYGLQGSWNSDILSDMNKSASLDETSLSNDPEVTYSLAFTVNNRLLLSVKGFIKLDKMFSWI